MVPVVEVGITIPGSCTDVVWIEVGVLVWTVDGCKVDSVINVVGAHWAGNEINDSCGAGGAE